MGNHLQDIQLEGQQFDQISAGSNHSEASLVTNGSITSFSKRMGTKKSQDHHPKKLQENEEVCDYLDTWRSTAISEHDIDQTSDHLLGQDVRNCPFFSSSAAGRASDEQDRRDDLPSARRPKNVAFVWEEMAGKPKYVENNQHFTHNTVGLSFNSSLLHHIHHIDALSDANNHEIIPPLKLPPRLQVIQKKHTTQSYNCSRKDSITNDDCHAEGLNCNPKQICCEEWMKSTSFRNNSCLYLPLNALTPQYAGSKSYQEGQHASGNQIAPKTHNSKSIRVFSLSAELQAQSKSDGGSATQSSNGEKETPGKNGLEILLASFSPDYDANTTEDDHLQQPRRLSILKGRRIVTVDLLEKSRKILNSLGIIALQTSDQSSTAKSHENINPIANTKSPKAKMFKVKNLKKLQSVSIMGCTRVSDVIVPAARKRT